MHRVKPGEVQVAAVHDVECAGLHRKGVQNVHVVHLGVGHEDHRGDVAPQVHQGVRLDAPLRLPELRPREQGEAEVDGGRVEGVDSVGQIHPEVLPGVQRPGHRDENLGEVGVDPPVPYLIGTGQGIAVNRAPEPHVVKLRPGGEQAGLDVSETFPEGELGEGHCQKLIPTGEGLDLEMAVVSVDAFAELV